MPKGQLCDAGLIQLNNTVIVIDPCYAANIWCSNKWKTFSFIFGSRVRAIHYKFTYLIQRHGFSPSSIYDTVFSKLLTAYGTFHLLVRKHILREFHYFYIYLGYLLYTQPSLFLCHLLATGPYMTLLIRWFHSYTDFPHIL